MKTKEMKALKVGDFIEHKHFGLCFIREVMGGGTGFWALVISPLEMNGIYLLRKWTKQTNASDVLEDSNRLIIAKVENPTLPKLIFKNTYFEVHQWNEDNNFLSTNKLAEFETIEEAQEYQKTLEI